MRSWLSAGFWVVSGASAASGSVVVARGASDGAASGRDWSSVATRLARALGQASRRAPPWT
ncbi:hypothetical protein HMPREF0321_1341 [Dermacoccus sp. Ellin185]|nr:hypothetical protein HMPREF0321_1341 [Dermacoccus sp. Ellin185]